MLDPSAVQLHGTSGWHHLKIAKVAVPAHAAQVRKAEALNRCLLVGVAWAVIPFVGVTRIFDASRNCVGTELDHSKRRCSTGEGLAFSQRHACARPDEGIHELGGST